MKVKKISKKRVKGIGSALVNLAIAASPFSSGSAANTYYTKRRGGYSGKTYLTHGGGLQALPESLWEKGKGKLKIRTEQTIIPPKEENLILIKNSIKAKPGLSQDYGMLRVENKTGEFENFSVYSKGSKEDNEEHQLKIISKNSDHQTQNSLELDRSAYEDVDLFLEMGRPDAKPEKGSIAMKDLTKIMSYCTPSADCSYGDAINYFATTGGEVNINNTSSCSSGDFSYVTSQYLSALSGDTIDIAVRGGSGTYNQGFGIWVDWNNDMDFNDAGERLWNSPGVSWSSFTGSIAIPSGLSGGTYRMRVRCKYNDVPTDPCAAASYGETEDYKLIVLPAAPNAICNGEVPEALMSDSPASGGTGDYQYEWQTSSDMGTTWDAAPGNNDSLGYIPTAPLYDTTLFRRMVTDLSCGAIGYSDTVQVNVYEAIQPNMNTTDIPCNGENVGEIDLSVNGGAPPYSYLWNDTTNNEDRSGLSAGTYTVTITDNNGCTATASATISEPELLTASVSFNSNLSCHGSNDGEINLSVNGGTPPYSYLWNDTISDKDRNGLSPGTYTVTVTDSSDCTATVSETIVEPMTLNGGLIGVD